MSVVHFTVGANQHRPLGDSVEIEFIEEVIPNLPSIELAIQRTFRRWDTYDHKTSLKQTVYKDALVLARFAAATLSQRANAPRASEQSDQSVVSDR